MCPVQPDNRPTLQAFHQWVKSVRCTSSDDTGSQSLRSFVPLPRVQAYFKTQRSSVQKILEEIFPDRDPPVDIETIERSYSRVFCILLLIGRGCYIESFVDYESLSDQHLPFDESAPTAFPKSANPFFSAFYEQQWEFCAPLFEDMMQRRFGPKVILPIILKEKIDGGGSAIAYKIVLHQAYNWLGFGRKEQLVFEYLGILDTSSSHVLGSERPLYKYLRPKNISYPRRRKILLQRSEYN